MVQPLVQEEQVKTEKRCKKATCKWNLRMIFSTKVLLSKTNVMQEKSVREKEGQNCAAARAMLRELGCFFFLGRIWTVAVPIFTAFNFSLFRFIFMPYHTC